MRASIIILTLFVCYSCSTNSKTKRTIYISEFGWTFQIDETTKFKDSAFDERGNIIKPFSQAGSAESLQLFTIRDDSTNSLVAVVIHDSLKLNNWESRRVNDTKWYFKEISLNPNIKILDTVYTTELVDGIKFHKEQIKYFSKKRRQTISSFHYFAKFKRYELAINFSYTDNNAEEKYSAILKSSKFQK